MTCNLQWAAIGCNRLWTLDYSETFFGECLVSAWWVLKGSEGSFEGSFLPSCVTSPTNGPILPLELPSAVPGWHWLEMGPTPRHQPNNVVDPINDSQLICCWVHYLGWCKMTPNWLANGANGIVCLIRWKKCKERANKNSNKTWNRKEYQSNKRQKGMSKEVRKSILCFESPCYPSYSIANPWTLQSGQIIPRYSKYFELFIGQNQQNQLYIALLDFTCSDFQRTQVGLDSIGPESRNIQKPFATSWHRASQTPLSLLRLGWAGQLASKATAADSTWVPSCLVKDVKVLKCFKMSQTISNFHKFPNIAMQSNHHTMQYYALLQSDYAKRPDDFHNFHVFAFAWTSSLAPTPFLGASALTRHKSRHLKTSQDISRALRIAN